MLTLEEMQEEINAKMKSIEEKEKELEDDKKELVDLRYKLYKKKEAQNQEVRDRIKRDMELLAEMQKGQKCAFCGENDIYARGLCRNCYSRSLRNKTPEYKKFGKAIGKEDTQQKTPAETFYSKVFIDGIDLPNDAEETMKYVIEERLTEKEAAVIEMRCMGQTLDSVGDVFGISRERVRQIETKSIRKIRNNPRTAELLKRGISRIKEMEDEERKEVEEKFGIANGCVTLDTTTEVLGLSARASNCLRRTGIKTIRDICEKENRGELIKIRNLGEGTRNEILDALYECGINVDSALKWR